MFNSKMLEGHKKNSSTPNEAVSAEKERNHKFYKLDRSVGLNSFVTKSAQNIQKT